MISFEDASRILSYDPMSGDFTWLSDVNLSSPAGSKAGRVSTAHRYWVIGIHGKTYYAHRLAWLIFFGKGPEHEIDHINGDRLDNRISNLRDVPRKTNAQNQRLAHKSNKLGTLGVHVYGEKFKAAIWSNGKSIHLGTFSTIEEAKLAYINAKRDLHRGSCL